MNLLEKLSKRFSIEVFETGVSLTSGLKTYGAKLYAGGGELIGQSSRCEVKQGAIYWAISSAAYRPRHWRRFPELRKLIKDYHKELSERKK